MASTLATRLEVSRVTSVGSSYFGDPFHDFSEKEKGRYSRSLTHSEQFLLSKTGQSLLEVLSKCELHVTSGRSRCKKRGDMTPLQLSRVRERDRINQRRRRARWRGKHANSNISNRTTANLCYRKQRSELPYHELLRLREKERVAQQLRRQKLRLLKNGKQDDCYPDTVVCRPAKEESYVSEAKQVIDEVATTSGDKARFMEALGLVAQLKESPQCTSTGDKDSSSQSTTNEDSTETELVDNGNTVFDGNGDVTPVSCCHAMARTLKSVECHGNASYKAKRINRDRLSLEELERLRARERMAKRRQRARLRQRSQEVKQTLSPLSSSSQLAVHRKFNPNPGHLSSDSNPFDLSHVDGQWNDKELSRASPPNHRSGVSQTGSESHTDTFLIMRTRRSKTAEEKEKNEDYETTIDAKESQTRLSVKDLPLQESPGNVDSSSRLLREEIAVSSEETFLTPDKPVEERCYQTEQKAAKEIAMDADLEASSDQASENNGSVVTCLPQACLHDEEAESKKMTLLGVGLHPKEGLISERDYLKNNKHIEQESAPRTPSPQPLLSTDDKPDLADLPSLVEQPTSKPPSYVSTKVIVKPISDDGDGGSSPSNPSTTNMPSENYESSFSSKDKDSCIDSSVSHESLPDESSEDPSHSDCASAGKERTGSALSHASGTSADLSSSIEPVVVVSPRVSTRAHRRRRDHHGQADESFSSGYGDDEALDQASFNESELMHSSFDDSTPVVTHKGSREQRRSSEVALSGPKSLSSVHDYMFGKPFHEYSTERIRNARGSRTQRSASVDEDSKPISEKWKKWKSGLTAEQLERRRRSNREAQRRRRARLKCAELGMTGKIPETISYRRNPVAGRRSPTISLDENQNRGSSFEGKQKEEALPISMTLPKSLSGSSLGNPTPRSSRGGKKAMDFQGMDEKTTSSYLASSYSFRKYTEHMSAIAESFKISPAYSSERYSSTSERGRAGLERVGGTKDEVKRVLEVEDKVSLSTEEKQFKATEDSRVCDSEATGDQTAACIRYASKSASTAKGKGCRIKVTPQRKVELPRMSYSVDASDEYSSPLYRDSKSDLEKSKATLSSSWNYKSLLLKAPESHNHRISPDKRESGWLERDVVGGAKVSPRRKEDSYISSVLPRIPSEVSDASDYAAGGHLESDRPLRTLSSDSLIHYPGRNKDSEFFRRSASLPDGPSAALRGVGLDLESPSSLIKHGSLFRYGRLPNNKPEDSLPRLISAERELEEAGENMREGRRDWKRVTYLPSDYLVSAGSSQEKHEKDKDEIETASCHVTYTGQVSSIERQVSSPGRQEGTRPVSSAQSGAQVLTTLKQIAEMDYVSRYLASKEPITSYRCEDQETGKETKGPAKTGFAKRRKNSEEIAEYTERQTSPREVSDTDAAAPSSSKRRKQNKPRKLVGGEEV